MVRMEETLKTFGPAEVILLHFTPLCCHAKGKVCPSGIGVAGWPGGPSPPKPPGPHPPKAGRCAYVCKDKSFLSVKPPSKKLSYEETFNHT